MGRMSESRAWGLIAGALALATLAAVVRSRQMHALDAVLGSSLCGALEPAAGAEAFGHCAACWAAVSGAVLASLAGLRAFFAWAKPHQAEESVLAALQRL